MEPPPVLSTLLPSALAGDLSQQIATLEAIRLARLIHPDLTLKFGATVLSSSKGRRLSGNDIWGIYEQVAIAALYLNRTEWFEHCLQALDNQFPSSIRVKRLEGMYCEKKKDWQQAEALYSEILTNKPSDTATRKRMIAMLKAQKKTSEAIEECNAYLDIFQTDQEVWHELAELYISEVNLTKAMYCFTEVLLSNPRQIYAVLSFAELQYTLQDLEVARKYFCLACHLDESNLRGMWGLLLCLHGLGPKRDEKYAALMTITKKKIIDLYYGAKELTKTTRDVAIKLLDAY